MKENSDLKYQIKRLEDKVSYLREIQEKELSNLKLHYEMQEDEYKQSLEELEEKLNSIQNDEVLVEKLAYWKEKAKDESTKRTIRKKIISVADGKLLSKIFN